MSCVSLNAAFISHIPYFHTTIYGSRDYEVAIGVILQCTSIYLMTTKRSIQQFIDNHLCDLIIVVWYTLLIDLH